VKVFLFARMSQWERLADPGYLGHAWERPGGDYPRWYHEGLAQVLSSAVIRDDVAMVGSVAVMCRETLARFDPLPLERLLADGDFEDDDEQRDRFYADSFALVHFGLLGELAGTPRAAEFNEFVRRIRAGAGWQQAFARSFSDDVPAFEASCAPSRSRLPCHPSRSGRSRPEMARALADFGVRAGGD
jgi:hypothetical protein